MEQPFPIEDLVDRVGNRYAIVVAVAKRARQLKAGAKPLVDIDTNNPTTIALHEISAGYVQIMDELPPEEPKAKPDDIDELISLAAGDDDDADMDDSDDADDVDDEEDIDDEVDDEDYDDEPNDDDME